MSLPADVREDMRRRLWTLADNIGWVHLTPVAKARCYEGWTRDEEIGGVLGRYMDKGKVRVYLKDTLLKDYTRKSLADDARPLRVLGLTGVEVVDRFIKPHGLLLTADRVVSWGRADDWKDILMGTFERASTRNATPVGVVLLGAAGRFDESKLRSVVEDAAHRLGITRVVWLAS